jgi:transposase
VDAIRYLDRTGCQWDALPADFPHHKLIYHYFKAWTADGTSTGCATTCVNRSASRSKRATRNRRPLGELRFCDWFGRTIEYYRAQIRRHVGFRECSVEDLEKLTAELAASA